MYKGFVPGYVFKLGDEGVGYYRELNRTINLDVLIPADTLQYFQFSEEQPKDIEALVPYYVKRARRQRTAECTRKKNELNRRQTAIKLLPDPEKSDAPLCIPTTSTLQDRWWPKLGLWSITTSNPNSWAAATANVTNTSVDDFILLQETKNLHRIGHEGLRQHGKETLLEPRFRIRTPHHGDHGVWRIRGTCATRHWDIE